MRRLLIVGGGGFIGRAFLARVIHGGGREVVIAGRSNQPAYGLPAGVVYRQVAPSDLAAYAALLDWADEVVDFAYSSVPQTSFEDPVRDVLDNLPFNVALIKMASERSLEKFLFVSSGGTVYGHPVRLPIDEAHPTDPVSPYGITKLAVEKYGLMYWRSKRLQFVAVRPGNPYGPGQLGHRGQGFVATAMQQVLEGGTVTIFGERGAIRDYIYVDDLASGILAALEYAAGGSVLNIGTGLGIDNRQMVNAIGTLVRRDGMQLDVRTALARAFDVSANVLDSSKLRDISGWQPEVALETGLEKAWAWIKGKQV
jgi:UDP-glucose 4-epimerase